MRFHTELAAAYVRGRLGRPDLSDSELIALGLEKDLRLHRFKVKQLPRVSRVLGILKGLAPTELLDVGCGRGTFLWPLLDALPALDVTTIDLRFHRVRDVAAVRAGGIARVRPVCQSVLELGFAGDAFHVMYGEWVYAKHTIFYDDLWGGPGYKPKPRAVRTTDGE